MYTEFYGLRAEPFLLTPDHRFYFDSSVHSQAMAHLNYGLSREEGFIVITGEIGAGKTTLVKRLCASVDPDKILAAHVVTTLLSGSDLLRLVAAAFGIKDPALEKSEVLLRLQGLFETAHAAQKRVLLIVDEAQNLDVGAVEELRMLSNFQIGNSAPFQCFLVGQPEFRGILASPELEQLRQRIIASYHLGPMGRQECGTYLQHRLGQVGWKGDPEFEPSAVDAIFRHTSGIPRRINTICNRLMLLGFLDEMHRFIGEDVDKVAADLEAEGLGATSRAIPERQPPRCNDVSHAGVSPIAASVAILSRRVDQVEQQVARQERTFRRAASAAFDFLNQRRVAPTQDFD